MKADSVAGGVGLVFSLAYLALALQIPLSSLTTAGVGPRAFPIAIGIALALATLALLVKGLREARDDEDEPAEPVEAADDTLAQSPARFGVVIALLLGYIFLFVTLGYVISTALFVLAVTMYLDPRKWIRNLVYAVLFPLVVYFVFTELLQVTLPTGPMG